MISKEKFVELLTFISIQNKKQDRFIDALEELSPDTYCYCFLYSDYENKLVDLLADIMEDKDDDIGYFLYEYNWANNDINSECTPIDEETNEVLYDSPETLYDYLISQKEKRNAN